LVAGQHTQVGTVDVALDASFLYVTYNITAPNVYMKEIHADVFSSQAEMKAAKKLSNGGPSPGKFAYKASWGSGPNMTVYTVKIPRSVIDALPNCFYIATHAALSNGETAWGGLCTPSSKGVSLADAFQFDGSNWAVYFNFCKDACAGPIDFTYAWEDLLDNAGTPSTPRNDADYNDLVIQSAVTRTGSFMEIKFLATARGAGADHIFKFRIPKTGVTAILGSPVPVQDGGSDYIVTVFPSTQLAIPASGPSGFANTVLAEPCNPAIARTITVLTNGAFVYDEDTPYNPFISVYLSRTVSNPVPAPYDLYIYQVTGTNTWTDADGQVYPNGILISNDWQWPFEQNRIFNAYPNFNDITPANAYPNYTPDFSGGPIAGQVFISCN
jgi:LruC domain-containing protein